MNGLNGGTMEENMSAASSPESSRSSAGRETPQDGNVSDKKHDARPNSNSEDRTLESERSPESSKEPDNDIESDAAKPLDKMSVNERPESSEMDPGDIVHSTTNLGETENSNDSNSDNDNSVPNHAQRVNNLNLENGDKNDSNLEAESVNSSRAKDKSDRGTEDESEAEEGGGVVHEIQTDSDGEDDEVKAVTMHDDESEDMESDEDSSDDEDSDVEFDEVTSGMDEEPVSINSDSDPEVIGDDSAKKQMSTKTNVDSSEVLLVEDLSNQGEDKAKSDELKNGKQKAVIHEILSDNEDCILPDVKDSSVKKAQDVENRRRSSRNVGRQSYKEPDEEIAENGGRETDLEEIVKDPLDHKAVMNNSNVTNDTKKLFEFASKQIGKASSINLVPRQQKKPSVKLVDPGSIMADKPSLLVQPAKTPYSMMPMNVSSPQALYQSIASRGTTVTPMSVKTTGASNATNSAAPTPPIILPSLTDDMFVVEAPSFIVPYVYEKPSVKPFKEFVDNLGKDLEEQRLKKEQARIEKEKELQEKLEKERKEKGIEEPPKVAETVEKMDCDESKNEEDMEVDQDDSIKDKETDKKSQKKRRKGGDDDDASWDGESSSDSDDENMSDDDRPKTVIIKEKEDDSVVEIKDPVISDSSADPKAGLKSDSYFDNSLGKFFINIGGNLVQEYVQNDLLRQQKRKLHAEKRSGTGNPKGTETAINSLMKNLEFSKENNAPYKFQQKKCEFCSFKTESALAMAHHMETPHMKNNVYKCNFCAFEIRSPHDILYHMEAEHNTRGRLERAPAYHQCANCPFEDNGKGKLARHLIACAKKFKPDYNLSPPVEWEPPAKIPKVTRARQHGMMNSYQAAFAKAQPVNTRLPHPSQLPMVGPPGQMFRGRGKPPFVPAGKPVHGAPLVREGVMYRSNTPQQVLSQANYQLLPGQAGAKAGMQIPKSLQHQPSISITPLPRSALPPPLAPIAAAASAAAALGSAGKSSFVICEICDGYIKDLEQLRNHMQWIHKVKIHPKMIYNRPPLNCQKCQFRFFTDQGLERHLLGSHGLVTSSMQEAANKGKDAGRCPVCGRVYQWKLLNHVARDHSMTLKPAHLSYKCTVCTATFGMYKQFENHVYSAHSVVVKREIDKNKGAAAAAGSSKSQKINDESKNAVSKTAK